MIRIIMFCALLTGCAAQPLKGGGKSDYRATTVVDGGVALGCSVTRVRLVNGSVWLEC